MNIYDNLRLLDLDLQGWNGTSSIFSKLIDEVEPALIIEVGSWKGQSAITMANHIKHKNLSSSIICVDTWLGALEFFDETMDCISHEGMRKERDLMYVNGYPNIYYQFLSNVVHTENQHIITPLPNTSLIASRYFKNNNIFANLIYIDGSHDYEDVLMDLKAYFPILSENGVIFGDDYIDEWQSVKNAVNEFARNNFLTIEVFENNFWILRK